ncbi:MAG TPA: nucleotidyltransferase domain-containing protein [Oligoflexia bacterium]|nr:nucleotidyltransferase domain-containing protein [Oligoflexia bacterium]HMP49807.1 nucleotidyltransferase domain-containing protein [Oligoflexia bacterium]
MGDPNTITKLNEILSNSDIVSFAYLFGSRATGHSRPNSDYDIAIFPEENYLKCSDKLEKLSLFNKLQENLEKALGSVKLDLIDLNTATPLLKYKVIRNGLLIMEKNRSFKANKVSRWTMEYLDLKPFLEMRSRTALSNLSGEKNVP